MTPEQSKAYHELAEKRYFAAEVCREADKTKRVAWENASLATKLKFQRSAKEALGLS